MPLIHRLIRSGRVDSKTTFHGASLGAFHSILSCLMVCDHDQEEAKAAAQQILLHQTYYIANVNVSWYRMWGRLYDVTYAAIVNSIHPKFLDCFQGKCHMSITQVLPFRNKIINTFDSVEDLGHQCAISMCIPFFSVLSPFALYRGEAVCDGVFTNNTAKPSLPRGLM
jgi:hypothetical protein